MSAIEWNKKEDLLQDQALRHLKQYTTLFAAFATTSKSEIVLLNKIQEYCYENMNFLKTFSKIVLLLYKSELNFSQFSSNFKQKYVQFSQFQSFKAILFRKDENFVTEFLWSHDLMTWSTIENF